jgi:hypothetical protein
MKSLGPHASITVLLLIVSLARADDVVQGNQSVPKAVCGRGDREEIVQGQTTLAERFGAGAARAYTCNLELVGQFEGEGAGFDLEVLDTCAYYATAPNPKMRHPGTVVLDVSDSRNPRATAYLDTPAMLNPIESLAVDAARKVLLASKPAQTAAEPFDVYDLSPDCRHPRLQTTKVLPNVMSHSGEFGPDGELFYGTSWDIPAQEGTLPNSTLPPLSAVFVIDMSDSSAPKRIATWIPQEQWKTHSISVRKDGRRAYVAMSWRPSSGDRARSEHGLVILDIDDFQSRRSKPEFRLVSTLFWDDTHEAQFIVPATINGSSYLIFTDLTGAIGYVHPASPDACKSGKPGHGFPRIIDISDEKTPRVVAKLMLEVSLPSRCERVSHDPTAVFGYGSVACDVDSRENAQLLACGFFEGGLRVFDIRKPDEPREVAYYKPPARRKEQRLGSMPRLWGSDNLTADPVVVPRFRNQKEIWFLSTDNAFQVVRFTEDFKLANKSLFRN